MINAYFLGLIKSKELCLLHGILVFYIYRANPQHIFYKLMSTELFGALIEHIYLQLTSGPFFNKLFSKRSIKIFFGEVSSKNNARSFENILQLFHYLKVFH